MSQTTSSTNISSAALSAPPSVPLTPPGLVKQTPAAVPMADPAASVTSNSPPTTAHTSTLGQDSQAAISSLSPSSSSPGTVTRSASLLAAENTTTAPTAYTLLGTSPPSAKDAELLVGVTGPPATGTESAPTRNKRCGRNDNNCGKVLAATVLQVSAVRMDLDKFKLSTSLQIADMRRHQLEISIF